MRRYAAADVNEAAGVARVLGGAAFALARLAPRRYERLADAGAATGVLDPIGFGKAQILADLTAHIIGIEVDGVQSWRKRAREGGLAGAR